MEIREIKERLTIMAVLQHYGLEVNQSNCLKCPFHEAKPGSRKKTLQVYTDTNRYQCFHQGCTAGNGDVIDFIQNMEKCSKHQAIEKAKEILGVKPMSKDVQDAHPDVDRDRGRETEKVPANGFFDPSFSEQLKYYDENVEITALGGIRLDGLDRMRVTVKVQVEHLSIRHNLDLYNDGQVQKLVRLTASRLEIGTSKVERALQNLTDHLESYRLEMLESQKAQENVKPETFKGT